MAKDDYHVICYRILLYLYAVLQRKILFDITTFKKALNIEEYSEDYLKDVIRLMQDECLIKNVEFTKTWGREYVMMSDYEDIEITANGIRYLKENSTMQKVKDFLLASVSSVADLIIKVGL